MAVTNPAIGEGTVLAPDGEPAVRALVVAARFGLGANLVNPRAAAFKRSGGDDSTRLKRKSYVDNIWRNISSVFVVDGLK